MLKEKWLNALVFDTGLVSFTELSAQERDLIIKYLLEQKSSRQISEESGLPVSTSYIIIQSSFEKILLALKEIIAKKMWFQEILKENKQLADKLESLEIKMEDLRKRFKVELEDEELTAQYERMQVSVTMLALSRRARNILARMQINTLNDLAGLTRFRLLMARNAGTKTAQEIVSKALEFGIVLPEDNKGLPPSI